MKEYGKERVGLVLVCGVTSKPPSIIPSLSLSPFYLLFKQKTILCLDNCVGRCRKTRKDKVFDAPLLFKLGLTCLLFSLGPFLRRWSECKKFEIEVKYFNFLNSFGATMDEVQWGESKRRGWWCVFIAAPTPVPNYYPRPHLPQPDWSSCIIILQGYWRMVQVKQSGFGLWAEWTVSFIWNTHKQHLHLNFPHFQLMLINT